jgi:hypothetical protein
VLGFLSSRPNRDPPTPSYAGECALPFGSGGKHSLAGEGVGGYRFGRGDRKLGISVLGEVGG